MLAKLLGFKSIILKRIFLFSSMVLIMTWMKILNTFISVVSHDFPPKLFSHCFTQFPLMWFPLHIWRWDLKELLETCPFYSETAIKDVLNFMGTHQRNPYLIWYKKYLFHTIGLFLSLVTKNCRIFLVSVSRFAVVTLANLGLTGW